MHKIQFFTGLHQFLKPKKYIPLIILLVLYFSFSLITFKDYGITFDEETEYSWGNELLQHYSHNTKFKNTIAPVYEGEEKHQRHTPILSQYYRIYPATLNALNVRHTYEFFHLLNMIFASVLIIVTYITSLYVVKDWKLASLAPVFVFLTPRFLGHIPANPKDMPFSVIYFCTLCLIYFSKHIKNRDVRILLLGISFGLTQSLRLIGVSIYLVYLIWLFITYIQYEKNISKKISFNIISNFVRENLAELFFIFLVANFFMVLTWPYMGINYFKNFPQVFLASKDFEYWDKSFFYLGKYIPAGERPWHYLPVFMLVTTPIFILVNFMFSIGKVIKSKSVNPSLEILLTLALLVNFGLYFVFKPLIYNGLRHFLFILPLISYLAYLGFIFILKSNWKYKKAFIVGVLLNIAFVIITLIKLHPYEYIYFNEIAGGTYKASRNFELDYWGASYKESMDWLNANLKDENINLYACNNSFAVEYYAKSNITREYEITTANYAICDTSRSNALQDWEIIHVVERTGTPLNFVLKKPISYE